MLRGLTIGAQYPVMGSSGIEPCRAFDGNRTLYAFRRPGEMHRSKDALTSGA